MSMTAASNHLLAQRTPSRGVPGLHYRGRHRAPVTDSGARDRFRVEEYRAMEAARGRPYGGLPPYVGRHRA